MDISVMTGRSPRSSGQGRQQQDENVDMGGGALGNHVRSQVDTYPSYEENGRLYHGFRRGMYMYPCDENEQDRLDLFHRVLCVARREILHSPNIKIPSSIPRGLSSIHDQGPRILDLGCGTGIWAIDIAKKYPHAYVLGIDLAPMQPSNRPPNCEFQSPRDFESPWLLGENSWDFIHLQMGCGSVSNWPNLYNKVYAHLKPGTGYFEQVEIDFEPFSVSGTPNEHLIEWYRALKVATDKAMRPIAFNRSMKHTLKEAGFVDVKQQVEGLPLNEWPEDPTEKLVGKWYNLAYSESALTLLQGPLTRISGLPPERIQDLANRAITQAYDKRVQAWNHLQVYTARKPR
ncbi:methyltransferase [Microsporum canis CBS 113480]|uniref:Velvet complex subunit laeA n=1 Tax=Arthroderma otae (strain ATCC MYA-4605 / CBS 113480) TaxID=554155 RepID=C5FCL4_ARTOC|nr:methyltransferase [Microsporum canis CBS 113480]EEQ27548.1 methyltransferase [Microsporum canis CBS 113480]